MGAKSTQANYDGYTSCPLFTGDGKLMLMEFIYDGEPQASFYADQTKPRKLFYLLKKEVFPRAFFDMVPKSKWHGKNMFFQHFGQ